MAIGNNVGFESDEGVSMREMFDTHNSFITETSKNIGLTADEASGQDGFVNQSVARKVA